MSIDALLSCKGSLDIYKGTLNEDDLAIFNATGAAVEGYTHFDYTLVPEMKPVGTFIVYRFRLSSDSAVQPMLDFLDDVFGTPDARIVGVWQQNGLFMNQEWVYNDISEEWEVKIKTDPATQLPMVNPYPLHPSYNGHLHAAEPGQDQVTQVNRISNFIRLLSEA